MTLTNYFDLKNSQNTNLASIIGMIPALPFINNFLQPNLDYTIQVSHIGFDLINGVPSQPCQFRTFTTVSRLG